MALHWTFPLTKGYPAPMSKSPRAIAGANVVKIQNFMVDIGPDPSYLYRKYWGRENKHGKYLVRWCIDEIPPKTEQIDEHFQFCLWTD